MDAEKTNVIANRALEEIPNLSSIQKAVLQKWYKQKVFFKIDDMKRWISEAPLSNGAIDLLNWANEHPYLKVARTRVPQGIITTSGADEEVYHEIIDITVRPPTVKSRGHGRILDDDIYDLFPRVRQFVPRGLCLFASIASSTSEIKESQVVIFGMKKFTGGPGDDDDMEEEESEQVDNRPRYEHYFTEAFNQCVELIDTSKENGEASHLGQVRLGDQLYYVMGSKNVHLLVGEPSHIALYTENRFMVAKQVATGLFNMLNKNEQIHSHLRSFMDYMNEHHLSATFEFLQLDNQHVELFDFDENKFRFIAFTSLKNLETLCADDIEQSVKVARDTGFETISVQKYPASDQDKLFEKIRSGYGKEGSVVYYVNAQHQVVGLVKKKTMWYVLVRSIREKMKNMCHRWIKLVQSQETTEQQKTDFITRFNKRIHETIKQKQDWLGFNDEVRQAWNTLALSCAVWIREEFMKDAATTPEFSLRPVERMFPVVWYQFLKETNQSDKIAFK